jgi:RNA polymerase sigma factor (sigma-70 family)
VLPVRRITAESGCRSVFAHDPDSDRPMSVQPLFAPSFSPSPSTTIEGDPPLAARAPAAGHTRDVRVRMEDLVRQYGRLIAAMVRRVGRHAPEHLREDIQQRVLIALWKQLRRDQPIEHPTTYIYRTAVRETLRVMRQEAACAQEPIETDGPAGLRAEQGDPYTALDRKEKLEHIRSAIEAIAPERRLAVWAHLSGFGVAEIMARYGWPYQKARNLVARGMADLRRILQENGLGPRVPVAPANKP